MVYIQVTCLRRDTSNKAIVKAKHFDDTMIFMISLSFLYSRWKHSFYEKLIVPVRTGFCASDSRGENYCSRQIKKGAKL